LLAEQGGGAEALERLRLELQRAEGRQRALLDAAGMDYRAIARANRDAIVLVIVEYMDGTVVSGTGFAIDSSGTIVTNKHVLVGEDGTRRPNRLGVKFAGSRQFFRAEFLGTADDFDVGAVRVTIAGGTPRVAGIVAERETVEQGDPVAVLGFPLGLSLPMDRAGGEVIADPSLTVGTVSRVLANLVQVDGYGAPGSSGSPVFDRHGRVIGVLFGGERESQGKVVYVVPSYLLVQYLTGMGLYRR
jgi:S1-C subfamily serine protease